MTVYVVMGNDYPDAVFENEVAAQKYVEGKQAQETSRLTRRKIHWRYYPFNLQKEYTNV